MKLIIDAGSTTTEFRLLQNNEIFNHFSSAGINTYNQKESYIDSILNDYFERIATVSNEIKSIYYFGAGVKNNTQKKKIEEALVKYSNATKEINSDLMASALACIGYGEGIVCILGTGSNVAYLKERLLIKQIFASGFLFGDLGSGYHIGQSFLSKYFSDKLPLSISSAFEEYQGLNKSNLLAKIYHSENTKSEVASITKFIYNHKSHPYLSYLVKNCFFKFLDQFSHWGLNNVPINFTGGIAFHFNDLLMDVLNERKLIQGKVIEKPIDGLVDYFSNK